MPLSTHYIVYIFVNEYVTRTSKCEVVLGDTYVLTIIDDTKISRYSRYYDVDVEKLGAQVYAFMPACGLYQVPPML